MLKASHWKIFYDDGSTFSNDDGLAEEAPVDGILAIVERRQNNTVMNHHAKEYYYWTGENWVSGGVGAMERWMRKELPALKYGRWTKESIWQKVIEEVNRYGSRI